MLDVCVPFTVDPLKMAVQVETFRGQYCRVVVVGETRGDAVG